MRALAGVLSALMLGVLLVGLVGCGKESGGTGAATDDEVKQLDAERMEGGMPPGAPTKGQ